MTSTSGDGLDPGDDEVLPTPDPYDVLGRIPTGETLRRELAAAARSLGRESSVAPEMREIHESIVTMEIPEVDLEIARERLAEATGTEERLKERVATARGDVRARRSVDVDTDEALADLEKAAAALSSAQTERVAAEQALERQRERASAARDARERRLRLQDRLSNLQRDARRELGCEVYPAFREGLTAVPGGDPDHAGDRPSDYDGPAIAASLAAVRIAELSEPVAVSDALLDDLVPAGSDASLETLLDATIVRPDR